MNYNQEAKADKGKPMLSLVPTRIIEDIAEVRMFGTEKYKDPDNWKNVEKQRYIDAAFRHWIKYIKDNKSTDPESGLLHLAHVACNISFLCEMEAGDVESVSKEEPATCINCIHRGELDYCYRSASFDKGNDDDICKGWES